jgi:UDP-N-acetyl-D-mannosaminuronic acid dehydrogenase
LPGQVLRELRQNDRIIGGLSEKCSEKCTMLYNYFVEGNCIQTNARTAELAKLTENSFRDVNIAFANELSILCEQFGVNVWELIKLANRHPRVNILSPGTGVGGHCIAVDPWFIVYAGKENAKLIRAAREINDHKTEWVISQIISEIEKFVETNNRQPKVACLGLAFKPNIDDLRGSPALQVYQSLVASGVAVSAVEPNLIKHDNIILTDFEVALTEADIKVFLVGHKEFKNRGVDGIILDFCGVTDR